ncbi:transcriptional repressor scratch 1 [Caerostris extrusa]|uniref:Transcriptional repressor scratch 1 n=1 Tax=Caerostris extrusa TaxID=172846 RepID=A0AAV4S2I0_CAEEX|nr:transcriptional repressor scratch 1 [Caerostris extrusa]
MVGCVELSPIVWMSDDVPPSSPHPLHFMEYCCWRARYIHDVLPSPNLLGYDQKMRQVFLRQLRDGVFDKELDLSSRSRERSRDHDISDASSFCSRVSESSLSPGLVAAPSAPVACYSFHS